MKKEVRTAVYDLGIESYRLEGLSRPFPNHFHCHFVLGLVERGERWLSCNNARYKIAVGNIVLFNPGDNHGCVQSGGVFDYRGMNVSKKVMMDLTRKADILIGSRNVFRDGGLDFVGVGQDVQNCPPMTACRNKSFTRVCHPFPLLRSASKTSASRRML